jgi:hypothetical protein
MEPKQKKQKIHVKPLNPRNTDKLATTISNHVVIEKAPFTTYVLSDLLNDEFLPGLIEELQGETWFLKRNDLYEFYVRLFHVCPPVCRGIQFVEG